MRMIRGRREKKEVGKKIRQKSRGGDIMINLVASASSLFSPSSGRLSETETRQAGLSLSLARDSRP